MTQEELKKILRYNPETGIFSRVNNKTTLERLENGYIRYTLNGKNYLLHRMAFLYMIGYIPIVVDHKNRIRNDNRWCNLREATQSINSKNRFLKPNISGHHNIYTIRSNYFQVKVAGNYIGSFKTIEAAIIARDIAIKADGEYLN